jgi:glycosyltransferase involved in cell wall biosynthesis
MNFLFVHQNFPGQYRHVAAALAHDPAHQVVALGETENLQGRPAPHPRIRLLGHPAPPPPTPGTHHYIRDYERAIRRGQLTAKVAIELQKQGFRPDVVAVHPGWGEGLFLKDIFPAARHIHYCEFFYRGEGSDVGFDPEYPAALDDKLRVRIKNSTQLIGMEAADAGISPTQWQKAQYPACWADKIHVLHEGIDTAKVRPNPQAALEVDGRTFKAGDPVITYVARNLEPYRGFHVFLRTLPQVLAAHPTAHVLIVGGEDVSYGVRPPQGKSYRGMLQEELGDRLDGSRIHFLGKVPYERFLNLLQVSAVHVYLTYPFVLSWSLLEAMSAGCLLVASDTAPVREVIRHEHNGLLTDFFDTDHLAKNILEALNHPARFAALRHCAREDVVAQFDLATHCLPEALKFYTGKVQSHG